MNGQEWKKLILFQFIGSSNPSVLYQVCCERISDNQPCVFESDSILTSVLFVPYLGVTLINISEAMALLNRLGTSGLLLTEHSRADINQSVSGNCLSVIVLSRDFLLLFLLYISDIPQCKCG